MTNIKNFSDWIDYGQYNRWFFMRDIRTLYDSLTFAIETNNYSEVRGMTRRILKCNVDNLRDNEIKPFVYQQIFLYIHYQHILITYIPAAMYAVRKRFLTRDCDIHMSDGVFYGILCEFEIENFNYDMDSEIDSFKEIFNILYEKNKDRYLIKWEHLNDLVTFERKWRDDIEVSLSAVFYMCGDLKIGNGLKKEIEEFMKFESINKTLNRYIEMRMNEVGIEYIDMKELNATTEYSTTSRTDSNENSTSE